MNITSALLANPLPPSIEASLPTALPERSPSEMLGSFAGILATTTMGYAASPSDAKSSAIGPQEVSPEEVAQQQKQIEKIAEDFEAIFVSMMLKELRNTSSVEEGGGLFGGEGSDTYGAMFDMFIGQHIASSNQLGIADAFRSYLNSEKL